MSAKSEINLKKETEGTPDARCGRCGSELYIKLPAIPPSQHWVVDPEYILQACVDWLTKHKCVVQELPTFDGPDWKPSPYSTRSSPKPATLDVQFLRQLVGHQKFEELIHLVLTGNLILAIKELRTVTNWGLKESKETIDWLKMVYRLQYKEPPK